MRVLAVIAISMFIALTARLWYLQALKSDEAKDIATTNITRVVNIEAPRGQIYDSSGKLLVGNRIVASVKSEGASSIGQFGKEDASSASA